jgi:hypothetical protein
VRQILRRSSGGRSGNSVKVGKDLEDMILILRENSSTKIEASERVGVRNGLQGRLYASNEGRI